MNTYVFEDVNVTGGWFATIAVHQDEEEAWVAAWMAVNSDGTRYCTRIRRHNATVDDHHAIDDACDVWLTQLLSRTAVASEHERILKDIRGKRALHAAVMSARTDPAIAGQTMELLHRSMAGATHPYRTGSPWSDTTNDGSMDADWRDPSGGC